MKYLSEIIYGGVDGIITTFAIISGSMGANLALRVPIIIGIASLFADGFSMGVSSYLAEQTRFERKNPLVVGVITFLSFITVGMVPLVPYIFNLTNAFGISAILMSISLFIVGFMKSMSHGFQTLVLGLGAAVISYYIGNAMKQIK